MKTKFLIKWILLTLAFLTIGYIIGYIAGISVNLLLGNNTYEQGSYLSQILVYCAFGSVVAGAVSLTQLKILKSNNVIISKWWILAGILGIVISEVISGIILWQLGINRSSIGVFQGGPQIPEALVFSFSGLLIGTFQWITIRKKFSNSVYWIPANFLGWGLGHLVMFNALAFFIGAILLGIITGLCMQWILKINAESHLEMS
jgi:hypothetical protein